MKNNLIILFLTLMICSCSLAPGMHMHSSSTWLDNEKEVYIDSIEKVIKIKDISSAQVDLELISQPYRIGYGDQLSITVWGLQDVFPISNITPDQNLRRVDSNGDIFFPYVGIISAKGMTQNEIRDEITNRLSQYFNDPQLDVSIVRFNSQQIYLLGEITKPTKINITDVPLSLSDAIGQSFGIRTNTADGSSVFIIRHNGPNVDPEIFIADLSSPAGFVASSNFLLQNNDIVYVNAKGTTRWNRVVSQFFPFSSFLNSVDNLLSSD